MVTLDNELCQVTIHNKLDIFIFNCSVYIIVR